MVEKISFPRYFTVNRSDAAACFEWKTLDAVIKSATGKVVFEQKDVRVPSAWSQRAANIVAEKYFRTVNGVRETSAQQMAERVAKFIRAAGVDQGLLDPLTAQVFEDELVYLVLAQAVSFNSPVWFNVGATADKPQGSACFINGVTDDMGDITDLQKKEVMLFKHGSGTGSNLSPLRSSYEKLTNGGIASGPVSFAKGFDAWAGVTKSGGGTRRAAKMNLLDIDHPDILTCRDGSPGFIPSKRVAEQLAHDLYSTGKYTAEFNVPGNVYDLVPYQNANHSVRVTDEFMRALAADAVVYTRLRTSGKAQHTYKAADLWKEIAEAAWFCGDPGVQFTTTINDWHTCPNTGPINGSNPCSEYLFLDDSACNLASFNLMFFYDAERNHFCAGDFEYAVGLLITAMEILVGACGYPSEKIAANSRAYRPLGLGYANLGALLMNMGVAYDSDAGRATAAAITALLSGAGYAQSAAMAQVVGAFEGFLRNEVPFRLVMAKHAKALSALTQTAVPSTMSDAVRRAADCWEDVTSLSATPAGFRNAQICVIAPTGTISFMMDCETTGCEPMLDIVQYKKLVGGGVVKMLNNAAMSALGRLGYSKEQRDQLIATYEAEGRLDVSPQHRAVFQTAIGADPVSVQGHLLMMAAIQPFVSGAISKTVNMPASTTAQEIANTYLMAWQLGLKCVALFRDGCKLSQPANTSLQIKDKKAEPTAATPTPEISVNSVPWGSRKKLPATRQGLTHKATLNGQDFYLHASRYPDGALAEVFIDAAKAGSTMHGLLDALSITFSTALQHGAPAADLAAKLRDLKFEPEGMTGNRAIPMASSLPDYLARWLELEGLLAPSETVAPAQLHSAPNVSIAGSGAGGTTAAPFSDGSVGIAGGGTTLKAMGTDHSGPPCKACGNLTRRAGACWVCNTCGQTTGCG